MSSGLIYLRNRYYDPSVGRFISEDPIRSGSNWYVYCENNPINGIDPTGLDVYYFVASQFKGEATRVKKMLGEKFNEPIHIIVTDDADTFTEKWNAMGTENGEAVNITAVIINSHASPHSLNNINKDDLKGKDIGNILLLGCNAGHLDHIYDNVANTLIKNNNVDSVIASDGTVNYRNKGFFKSTKRTQYYVTSREDDDTFVSYTINKNDANRNPQGFVQYILKDGVYEQNFLGTDFANINNIFNAAGIYDVAR